MTLIILWKHCSQLIVFIPDKPYQLEIAFSTKKFLSLSPGIDTKLMVEEYYELLSQLIGVCAETELIANCR